MDKRKEFKFVASTLQSAYKQKNQQTSQRQFVDFKLFCRDDRI